MTGIERILIPQMLGDMRDWLELERRSLDVNGIEDASLPSLKGIGELSDAEIYAAIEGRYIGGVATFLADSVASSDTEI